jgi:hypothetical protein
MVVFAKLFDKSLKKKVVSNEPRASPLNVLSTAQGREKVEKG